MTIQEIYEKLDAIGCLSFSTLENGHIESRIAHFFAHDEEGLYLRTMNCKPFYRQMEKAGHLSVCGMYPQSYVAHDDNNLPFFKPGYTIRLSGEVRELSIPDMKEKAKTNRDFNVAAHDLEKYPATRFFVLHKASGEHYDYDFAMKHRDHKLLRTAFAFGGAQLAPAGFRIQDTCIACGACFEACSFKAIVQGEPHHILKERCDECGNCLSVCPVDAIVLRGE